MTRHTPDNPSTVNTARVWVDQAADAYKQGLADGRTAERDRLRELAIEHRAHFDCDPAWGTPFADLLGDETP